MCWPTGGPEEKDIEITPEEIIFPESGPAPDSHGSELWVYPIVYHASRPGAGPQGSEIGDDDPSKPLVTEERKDTNSGES